jgi:nucleoside-diphosphate-sugar epimerase
MLVTGAGGFIGGWLAETLYLTGSAHVRAGVHSWAGAARTARFPMEIVLCDILEPYQIRQAVSGVSCVIHCAKGASKESIVQGTRNMLSAAFDQGVKRFVYLSTAEVYGSPTGKIDETFSCQKTGDLYGDSKLEAEEVCWEYHAKGLPVTVIRPSIVYGPFSTTWSVEIARKLLSGNWGIFKGHGDGICNLIYVSDLVHAILIAADDEHAIGEAFNLNGSEMLTWNQYFQMFNTALGLPELRAIEPDGARLRATLIEPVRTWAKFVRNHFARPIKKVAASYRPAKQLMKYVEQTMKTSARLTDFSLFSRQAGYTATKAQELLGFKPSFDVETGLHLTVSWLAQVGLADRPI